jgi:hypothetical protein
LSLLSSVKRALHPHWSAMADIENMHIMVIKEKIMDSLLLPIGCLLDKL